MAEWDKTTPSGSEPLRQGAGRIREMKIYLQDALSREHVFPGEYGDTAGKHQPGKVPVVVFDTKSNLQNNLADDAFGYATDEAQSYVKHDGSLHLVMDDGTQLFPSGTRCIFYQESAPVGWSIVSDFDDMVCLVDDSSGGATGGSWTISGLSASGHSHTLSTVPNHRHEVPHAVNDYPDMSFRSWPWGTGSSPSWNYKYKETGRDVSAKAGKTGDPTSVSSTTTSSETVSLSHDGNWRPPGHWFILCERD